MENGPPVKNKLCKNSGTFNTGSIMPLIKTGRCLFPPGFSGIANSANSTGSANFIDQAVKFHFLQ